MTNTEQPERYVKSPLSDAEMEQKLNEVRANVSKKMNVWADRVSVCMTPNPYVQRFEGEQWEEDGKIWVQKKGFKESKTLLDSARMPWWCPKCSKSMNHNLDRKFYYRKGMCYNCVIDWEGELRLSGEYVAYEKRIMRENEKSWIKDEIDKKIDYMRTFKEPQIHFGDGRWETLATKDQFIDLFKTLEQDIELMLKRLEVIKQEEENESSNKFEG